MLALVDTVSMASVRPPYLADEARSHQGSASSCQSGDSAHGRAMKGLCRNKKWDVVTFDMESNTVRSRSNLEERACKAAQWTGMALQSKPKLASSAVLCGLERPWLAGQGELGVAASSSPRNSRACYIGAARSPTGSARAGEIACLSAGSSPIVAA